MSSNRPEYRGRFAPSPTGPLHFGSLYTAVASFLQARSKGGRWLVRIDDLDPTRCKPSYSDHILKTLELYQLTWDEDVFYQHTRQENYKAALSQLEQLGLLYPCTCSRKDLVNRHIVNGNYDAYCLTHQPSKNETTALRIKLPLDDIAFNDKVQGHVHQTLKKDVGDFILFRKDNVASYHLAVALDDDEQKITEVLRGHDLLDSTPRQIMLQRILKLETPCYAHIPVISHADGAKLSKQTFAEDVTLTPVKQTLINVFIHLNLTPPTDLISCTVNDMLKWGIENWSLQTIQPKNAILYRYH